MSASKARKGPGLELQTAAYFQGLGYLVRRGVKLAVAAGSADATDIDVLAIRFSVPLAEERLIADCKDRKKSRPFERILWTRGLHLRPGRPLGGGSASRALAGQGVRSAGRRGDNGSKGSIRREVGR